MPSCAEEPRDMSSKQRAAGPLLPARGARRQRRQGREGANQTPGTRRVGIGVLGAHARPPSPSPFSPPPRRGGDLREVRVLLPRCCSRPGCGAPVPSPQVGPHKATCSVSNTNAGWVTGRARYREASRGGGSTCVFAAPLMNCEFRAVHDTNTSVVTWLTCDVHRLPGRLQKR